MNGSDWMALVQEAFRDPRRSAQRIAGWPLPDQALPMAFALIAALSVLGLYGAMLLSGMATADLPSPVLLVAMQLGSMLLLAAVLAQAGRVFGGVGGFAGALRIIIWIQALMVLLQVVQLVALVVLPPLGGLLSLVSVVAIGWVATGMVAGLHGFKSLPLTFLGIIGALLVVGFVLSLLLAPFISLPQ